MSSPLPAATCLYGAPGQHGKGQQRPAGQESNPTDWRDGAQPADAAEAEQKAGYAPEILILLQPTSPLRDANDVLAAFNVFEEAGCSDTVVSVCELEHPTAWVGQIGDDFSFTGIDLSGKPSQDYQKEYRLNGAVYVTRTEVLMDTRSLFTERLLASVMPTNRSFDIDDNLGFRLCETFGGD
jgi:N-acylneuraminate cytidylyltransferase/CMP-N,N'-diacetyllegionaminic acid synthase